MTEERVPLGTMITRLLEQHGYIVADLTETVSSPSHVVEGLSLTILKHGPYNTRLAEFKVRNIPNEDPADDEWSLTVFDQENLEEMNTLANELGNQFKVNVEATHARSSPFNTAGILVAVIFFLTLLGTLAYAYLHLPAQTSIIP